MNYLYDLKLKKIRNKETTLPMSHFFNKYDIKPNRRKCKKAEELIEKYSFELFQYQVDTAKDYTDYLLLRSDFENLLNDIRKTYISKNYLGLMSWLIDRAFIITPHIEKNKNNIKTTVNKNKSLLLKVLYEINKNSLLKCFSKNM